MRYQVIIFFIFIFSKVAAQSDGVLKLYTPETYKSTISGNWYFESGTFVYLESNFAYQDGFYIRDFSPFNNLNYVDARLGVQFQISDKWSGGLSQKLAKKEVNGLSYTEFNLVHQGKIKSLDFLKQASLEYKKHLSTNLNDLGILSLFGGLHKGFKVKSRQLGVMVSYRAFKIKELGGDEYSIYKKRFINKTILRVDAYIEAFKGIYVGLFALRDTEYYPTMNAGPNDRLNLVTPTYGVSLNFVINGKNRLNALPGMLPL
ncbi:hypothetical protein [Sporocytophaga myxococcoides]|uniref:hypothetical protein n=1 Tax=Sporocytophaga myxococcoides TaxID=153721 RepID=UPI0003F9A4F8|nr:hypothetical protein [Sporocytophaga myxococcoides]